MENKMMILIVILVLLFVSYFMSKKENFESEDTIDILTFVSKTCPHCVTYKNYVYPDLEKNFYRTNKNLRLIVADEDKDGEFDKYNIQYVPACVIIKNGKTK
jgi:glutaredoxin